MCILILRMYIFGIGTTAWVHTLVSRYLESVFLCPGTLIKSCCVQVPGVSLVVSRYLESVLLCPGTWMRSCCVQVPGVSLVVSRYLESVLLCPGTWIKSCCVQVPGVSLVVHFSVNLRHTLTLLRKYPRPRPC